MKKLTVLMMALACLLLTSATVLAKAAPDEYLTGVNTQDATIYGLAGEKPLYLNFWATWCPPCVGEMPAIEAMYQKYGDRIGFAAVSVDQDAETARSFIAQRGFTMPVYTGDLQRLANDYMLDAIPRSILIATDGSIIAEHVGGMRERDLEAFLSKAF